MEKVVVIILNYNGKHLLEKFLPGVVHHSKPYRVVVADNASEDDSINFLRQFHPCIQRIQLPKNEGFCKAYNIVLKQIEANYYILLNSDVEVTRGWITPIIQWMDENPTAGACQPKILSYHHKNKFEYAGAAGGFIDTLAYPFCRGRIFDTIEEDKGQYDDIKKIFWVSGTCFFVRASVFHALEGFDENFFAHLEEVDLCWRMQQQGFDVYYHSRSCVYHVGGATLDASQPLKTYLNFRNRALLLYKNATSTELLWKQWLRITLDLIAAIKFLFLVSRKHGWAVLKAQIDFFKMKKYYKPRQHNKKLNTIYKGLLPFDYFVKRKKKFSSL